MTLGPAKPSLDELLHFGVKGMKWGVRRDRMEATTLSKSERKEARTQMSKLTDDFMDKKYGDGFFNRTISETKYNSLSTKDHVVKKGQIVGRITTKKTETFKPGDVTYVSYKKEDRNLYRAVMPTVGGGFKLGGNKRYKNNYDASYKALETLKSPSEKARVDAFIELFDNPSIKLKNGKTVTGREFLKKNYPKDVKKLSSQQLGLKFYNEFTEGQGAADLPMNQAYFDRIRQKGYNAIVDDNDRGHLSKDPLIILNPNGSLKQMSIHKLTADDVNNAQRNLGFD